MALMRNPRLHEAVAIGQEPQFQIERNRTDLGIQGHILMTPDDGPQQSGPALLLGQSPSHASHTEQQSVRCDHLAEVAQSQWLVDFRFVPKHGDTRHLRCPSPSQQEPPVPQQTQSLECGLPPLGPRASRKSKFAAHEPMNNHSTSSTDVAVGTNSNSSTTSSFLIRTQPCECGWPIGSQSGVPWI